VISDVGPDFATRRQEAFNALTQIAASSPELMMLIGDLMFKAADFEYADEIAERLERMVPAAGQGRRPEPAGRAAAATGAGLGQAARNHVAEASGAGHWR
jgi:hypothetical protein